MTKRKLLSVLLAIAVLFTVLGPSVYAAGTENAVLPSAAESKSITETILTEVNVRAAVSTYFSQRRAFLRGEAETISIAIMGIVPDEAAHLAAMEDAEVSYVNSLLSGMEIFCWDQGASVTATEVATYYDGGQNRQETVVHDILVYMYDDGRLEISRDAYKVEIAGFKSCSYIDASEISVNAVNAGSSLCITKIAAGEVGYVDRGVDDTKYNDWFGLPNQPWCAIFVSWCANQANVSTSVIPREATCAALRTFFLERGKYYSSRSQGGSYTPKVGDLVFQNGSATSPWHVGIVTEVGSTYVKFVDGNSAYPTYNGVTLQNYSLTDTSLVAFASPTYVSSGHTGGTTWSSNASAHWKLCTNCDAVCSYASHVFVLVQTGGPYKCKTCNYTTYAVVNSLKSEDHCCS